MFFFPLKEIQDIDYTYISWLHLNTGDNSNLPREIPTIPFSTTSSFFMHGLLSIRYAPMMRAGNIKKVIIDSARSTTPGEITRMTRDNQTYAQIQLKVVKPNTLILDIFRISPSGIEYMHIADITKRLKAADPTIVPGPNSPASKPLPIISMTDSRISGALVPSASRLKFATVSFQTLTSIILNPSGSFWSGIRTFAVLDVIFSMAHMNTSAIRATPRKHHTIATKYRKALVPGAHVYSLMMGKINADEHV